MSSTIPNQPQTASEKRNSEEHSLSAEEEKRSLDSTQQVPGSAAKEDGAFKKHSTEPTFKSRGVIGVEAISRSAHASKEGRYCLYALAVLIYLLQWVVSAQLLNSS